MPLNYGVSCAAHDVGTPPECDATDPPNWCSDSWCFVDVSNCDRPTHASAYFPGGPHYSYATCGSSNRFVTDSCHRVADPSFGSFYEAELPSMTARTTNLRAPMVSITNCLQAPLGNSSCGPLVYGRTDYSNNWCARKAALDNGTI